VLGGKKCVFFEVAGRRVVGAFFCCGERRTFQIVNRVWGAPDGTGGTEEDIMRRRKQGGGCLTFDLRKPTLRE